MSLLIFNTKEDSEVLKLFLFIASRGVLAFHLQQNSAQKIFRSRNRALFLKTTSGSPGGLLSNCLLRPGDEHASMAIVAPCITTFEFALSSSDQALKLHNWVLRISIEIYVNTFMCCHFKACVVAEATTKSKLACLNEKLDVLERRLEVLEVQVSTASANPSVFT
ncbi:hypothetical protein M5K25_001884 [Dendrobium thyrsiflorum]|uniref:Uncharacterized protein n=1 Tax=Dendrobium thyrsiflorum TaxID=117978 RepID=A0ABD0VZZ5_DENTH